MVLSLAGDASFSLMLIRSKSDKPLANYKFDGVYRSEVICLLKVNGVPRLSFGEKV
jgi:hypothetical protein